MTRVYCEDRCPGDETCRNYNMCCCGEDCDTHNIGSGHGAVSAHYYYGRERPWYKTLYFKVRYFFG